jgi:transcriptional/translational regulatory protein YebC/TACO1
MTAVEAGAEDVVEEDGMFEIRTEPRAFQQVYDALQALGLAFDRAEVTQLPTATKEVSDEDAPKILKLLDDIQDNDDVQEVYANFDISDEAMAKMEG